MKTLSLQTAKDNEALDITDQITAQLPNDGFGIAHVFLRHTSAAITIADLDPGTDQDYLDAFDALIPQLPYRHPHDPSHVGDHILSAMIGTSLSIPFQKKTLSLGQWQRVILLEFDGPKIRELVLTFIYETC